MALQELTSREAVLAALSEFDELGRARFLEKYGFGEARGYFLVHEGRRYDSKAIAGAAFGHQYPARGALRPSEFSGGDASVRPVLEKLGFRLAAPGAVVSNGLEQLPFGWLQAGEPLTWDQLGEHFGFEPSYLGSAGGMVSRPQHGALLVISHPGGAKSFDYEDYWDGEELIYTGRGKTGPQKLEGQNRDLAENSRTVYVFEPDGPKRLLFIGNARCVDWWWAEGEDSTGAVRPILRFRLHFDDAPKSRSQREEAKRRATARPRRFDATATPADYEPGVPTSSPAEALARREKAAKEHFALVAALHQKLAELGWSGIEEDRTTFDLWAVSPAGERVIFEAKTVHKDNEVHQTRAALAQLLEYRHVHSVPEARLCVVTDRPVASERASLLAALGVAVVHRSGEEFRASGGLARQLLGSLVL